MAEGGPGSSSGINKSAESEVSNRLATFDHRWTGTKNKIELARAGFSYTGTGDKVECTSCGLKLLNWTPKDDPLHEHATRRPLCSFINSRYQQLGQNKPPKHPQYQELQARLDSFVGWPVRYVPKTPDELAAAGFFYIGSADRVTCFQCGITLRDWEEEHDPVTEHQRYSESCQFINKTDLNQLGVKTRNFTSENCPETNGAQSPILQTINGDANTNPESSETSSKCSNNASDTQSISKASVNGSAQPETKELNSSEPSTVFRSPVNTQDASSEGEGTTLTSSRLAEENKRLREKGRCKICKKQKVATLFLPCGHLVTCTDCGSEVAECILCGKTILGTVKTYFS